jgi:hypothetical protein
MPSQLDVTAICNLALDYLDEAPLTSIDDTGAVGRWFQRNFWPMAWSLMRKHPWNFALARASLAASALPPLFGWPNAYDLPSDCLRVLPLTTDGTENGRPVPFKVEGAQILTRQEAPLKLRYIRRIDNPGLFDGQFCDALAAALAQKAAHFITGKQSYSQAVGQIFASLINDAQSIDALEGTPDDPIDDFWLDARRA